MPAPMPDIDVNYFKTLGIATLYAIAAVFGMIGGCAAGVHYIASCKHPRLPFMLAYILIGGISGTAYFAVTKVFGIFVVATVDELILNCMIVGTLCSVAMFTANTTVSFIFKHLGIEVQITSRKLNQERRAELIVDEKSNDT